jgi:CHAD domain-containing protein
MNLLVMKPSGEKPIDRVWKVQLHNWRRLVEACARKASRRQVHALRVVTLRLLSYQLEPRSSVRKSFAERVVQDWIRETTRMRRALGVLRELDVFRVRAADLRASLEMPNASHRPVSRATLQLLNKLDEKFTERRHKARKRLTSWIAKKQVHLLELSHELESSMRVTPQVDAEGSLAVEIAALAEDSSWLDAKSLHELRKRVKRLRYLTEAAGVDRPAARRVLPVLRTAQTAIGTWHDWDALSKEARRIVSGRQAKEFLFPLLDELTAEWLKQATESCERMQLRLRELARHWDQRPVHPMDKKPIHRAEATSSAAGARGA